MLFQAVFCTLILSVTSFTYPKETPNDYIDPFDMVNYDSASLQYRDKKEPLDLNPLEKDPTQTEEKSTQETQVPDKPAEKPPSESTETAKEEKTSAEETSLKDAAGGNQTCRADSKPCECLEGAYMKQFNRMLLTKLRSPSDPQTHVNYIVRVTMKAEDFAVLNRYVSTEEGSIQDVNEVLSHIFGKVSIPEGEFIEPWIDFEAMIGISLHQIHIVAVALVIVVLVLIIFKIVAVLGMSWAQLAFRLMIVCFVISVPWNWLHLYKKASSKKTSEVMQGIPDECRPTDTSWYASVNSWYRATFTFMENKCDKYHEALEVDPFWEVSPLQALAVSCATFVFEPAEHAGAAISKFFRGLLQNIPIQWALPLFVVVVVLIIVILFMMFGYRVHVPFIGAIEPAQRITSQRERETRIFAVRRKTRQAHPPIIADVSRSSDKHSVDGFVDLENLVQKVKSLKAQLKVVKEALPPIQQQPLAIANVGVARHMTHQPDLYSTDNITAFPYGDGRQEGSAAGDDVRTPSQREDVEEEAISGEGDVLKTGIVDSIKDKDSVRLTNVPFERGQGTKGEGDSKVIPVNVLQMSTDSHKRVECVSHETVQPVSDSESFGTSSPGLSSSDFYTPTQCDDL